MTDINKNIKWQTYVRATLKESEDIDKTVEELLNKFKTEDLQKAIIDIYIIAKEKQLGTYIKYDNPNSYITFSSEADKDNEDKMLIEGLKDKYNNECI